MSFEKSIETELNQPDITQKLDSLGDFSLENTMCQELLPSLEASETFTATSFIEHVCAMNPESKAILSRAI